MIEANAMMQQYHQIADNLELGSHDRAVIVDRADIMMVKVIFIPAKILLDTDSGFARGLS